MKVALIVPCYNEQEALPIFYEEVMKVVTTMNCQYELIFVNDGSKDNTLSILKNFAAKDENVTYISFSRKFSMDLKLLCSFSLIKVSATPSLLARAVRPIRCT